MNLLLFRPLTELSISLRDFSAEQFAEIMFPSPYGVIYLITYISAVVKMKTKFPSPYGVSYLIT